MKKFLPLALALAFITPAQANEIPGTRVSGQGAVCAEGQGRGLEVNATTKEEWTYCIEIVRPPAPTVQQVETKAKDEVAQTITNRNAQDAPTVTAETTVIAEPQPITEELFKVEINATTQVETVTALSAIEKEQLSKDRAVYEAQKTARDSANTQAQADKGTEYCVNWSAQGQSGTECALEPMPASEEEVQDWWEIFIATFPDWYGMLSVNYWNW
jgi:hypothetical protein